MLRKVEYWAFPAVPRWAAVRLVALPLLLAVPTPAYGGDPAVVTDSKAAASAPPRPSMAPVATTRPVTGLDLFQRNLRGDGLPTSPIPAAGGPSPENAPSPAQDPRLRRKLFEEQESRRNWLLNSPTFGGREQSGLAPANGSETPELGAPRSALERRLRQDLSHEPTPYDNAKGRERQARSEADAWDAPPTAGFFQAGAANFGTPAATGALPNPADRNGKIDSQGLFHQKGEVTPAPGFDSPFESASKSRASQFGRLLDDVSGSNGGLGLAGPADDSHRARFDALLDPPPAAPDPFRRPDGASRSGAPLSGLFSGASTAPGSTFGAPRTAPPPAPAPSAPTFHASPGVLPLPSRFGP